MLREELTALAARRFRATRGGHRQRDLTLDVDSLPIEVHGHQPGSEYNGHYHRRIYHPLIATIGETGDIVDGQLRPGNAHTAEGALDFILPLVDRLEQQMCQIAAVRMDAGFPAEPLLHGLEMRRIPYVARVRNNKVLDTMAAPYLRRPVGRGIVHHYQFKIAIGLPQGTHNRRTHVSSRISRRHDAGDTRLFGSRTAVLEGHKLSILRRNINNGSHPRESEDSRLSLPSFRMICLALRLKLAGFAGWLISTSETLPHLRRLLS